MCHQKFAEQVRTCFPEGLTGIFSLGSSRTSYMLEQSQSSTNPSAISNINDYFNYSLDKIRFLMEMFFGLGGKNFILLGSIVPSVNIADRGQEYQKKMVPGYEAFFDDKMFEFCHSHHIDPYFLNLASWFHPHFPSEVHTIAQKYMQFKKNLPHGPHHYKLIIDMNIQPLYAIWDIYKKMDDKEHALLSSQIQQLDSSDWGIEDSSQHLFAHIIEKSCGIKIPSPHFYLASSSRGTLKMLTSLPTIHSIYHNFKLYFTPYPIFWLKSPTLQRIIEEVMEPKIKVSEKLDYQGVYSREQIQSEYERAKRLSDDPESTLGLSRYFGKN